MKKIYWFLLFGLLHTTLTQAQSININVIKNIPSCWGLCCGQIEVNANGTNPPFFYQWSTGEIGTDLLNITDGEYTVTVTDDIGNTATKIIQLGQLGVQNTSTEIAPPSCFDSNDAIIETTIIEGVPPFLVRLYDEQGFNIEIIQNTLDSTFIFENLEGGKEYQVVISDARVCLSDDFITTSMPEEFIAFAGQDEQLAVGETYNFLPAFSQEPESITWSPATGLSCTNCENPTLIASENICYTLEAKNQNGCIATDTICLEVGSTSVEQKIKQKNIKIFPNPFQNEISLTGLFLQTEKVEIFNFYGKKMPFKILHHSEKLIQLNLNFPQNGIYFLTLKNELGEITHKEKITKTNTIN